MNKRLRLSMALALALGGSHAYALGLGQIEVKSALNQPLVAQIPVLTSTQDEADGLAVRLASAEAFARAGLDGLAMQNRDIHLEVNSDATGRKIILVTTSERVSDPFLSFLLEVDWGKGKMLREYTVLLDPPSMVPAGESAPAAVSAVSDSPSSTPEYLDTGSSTAASDSSIPDYSATGSSSATSSSSYPEYSGDSYGPVATGDTLWSIAQRTRADDSVTVNQMMLALLKANPEAFIGNNINRLKKGAVLRIPGRDEATALAASEAAAQVREQMQSWHASMGTVAQPADSGNASVASSRSAAGSDNSRLELTPPGGNGDASATQSGATADGSGRELRAELSRAQEEVSALSQENIELKSRLSELEQLNDESRRLIELKDSELAAIQRRLEEAGQSADDLASMSNAEMADLAASLDDGDADAGAADIDDVDDLQDAELDGDVDEMEFAAADTEVDVGAEEFVAEPVAEEPVPAEAEELAPAVDPTPAQKSKGGILGFNSWVVGGAGVLVAGLLGLVALNRRKKKGDSKSGAPSLASAMTPAVADFDSSEQEEELIEALSEHPDDLQLHLDLLHHYFAQNDAEAFQMAAESMYAQVSDTNDSSWQEAVTLGQQIAPEHSLFAASSFAGLGSVSDAAADEFTDVPVAEDALADAESFSEIEEADALAEESARDSSFTDNELEALLDRGGAEASREIDWLSSDLETRKEEAAEEVADDMDEALRDLESQLGLDTGTPSASPSLDEFSDGGFDLDVGDLPSADADADAIDADAATTKLELARAYLDMGDDEGARGMLEEVLTEGNAEQRAEAQSLIDGIS